MNRVRGPSLLLPCVLAWALLAACEGGAGLAPDAGGTDAAPQIAELVLGGAPATGDVFVPVADGDDVELISGAQGGFHVWTTARLQGAAGTLYLDRTARRADDGTLVLRANRAVLEAPDEAMDEMWEHPGAMPSFMCPAPLGVKVFDEALVFRAVLLDEDENVLAEDAVTLVPRCPADGDLRAFCEDICAG